MARIRLRSGWTDRSLRTKGLIVIAIPLVWFLELVDAALAGEELPDGTRAKA
jgi:hypothetical protein